MKIPMNKLAKIDTCPDCGQEFWVPKNEWFGLELQRVYFGKYQTQRCLKIVCSCGAIVYVKVQATDNQVMEVEDD